ncbi:MFS general substrate transporter [Hortaea werneckii]|nr:MFS general substrate transporter [Hortaea werneckii]
MDHGTVLRSAPEKQVDNVEYNEHTEFTEMAIRGDNLDPNAEKKLVRKIDLFLLPCIWIVYLLSYMDRSNLGNARVAGMGDDLGITDDSYYLAVVLFQVGYVIAEIPCNMILSRSRPSIFIPIIMVFWGAICILIGIVKTWEQLVGLRFVLGIAEAGFSPAVMFIVSSWYRKHEQSKRFMVFHSAGVASGAFGSIIAGAITSGMEGTRDIEGWRWLFIIEGAITIACAFAVPFVLLDYPLTSKKLSPNERQMAYDRLIADGITSRNDNSKPLSHLRALKKAVTDWRLLPLVLGYMTIIGSMSLAYFYPTFTAELGYSRKDAQYMTAPIYGVALVVAIVLCILADIVPELRAIFTSSVLIVFGTVFAALSTSIFKPTARYVFLCFINTAVWAANPLSLSYTSTVLGPVHPEVRAICLAIVNGFANLAQLYGTYIFTASEPPEYRMGFAVYSAIFAIGSLIYLASFFIFRKWPFKG